MKAQESKGTSRLLVAVAVMAAVAALALALWGCAPQATTSMAATGGDAEATDEAAPSMYPDFTDRTSGNFNDTFSTTDMLNAGNRGCNACHEDLWDVMNMKDGYKHILTHVGYDKVLPPMYFPPFTPMIHNRSRQPAPAGYANVFPPLSAPPSNLSRNARASRARALSEPG